MKQFVCNTSKKIQINRNLSKRKYRAEYGVPEYGFYIAPSVSANDIIGKAQQEGYVVFANHANGNRYMAQGYRLIGLEKRQVISLLYNHFDFKKIAVDNVLKVIRIWIDG